MEHQSERRGSERKPIEKLTKRKQIVLLLGVSGSGKSTIGRKLAEALKCDFIDGDDYHSAANVEKMSKGVPLSDEDRLPWLEKIAGMMRQVVADRKTAVVACSGLKRQYRNILRVDPCVVGFLLHCSQSVIQDRMQQRTHWFNPELLRSQFEALELPTPDEEIEVIDVSQNLDDAMEEILGRLSEPE